jgi:hypothetical protein
MADSPAVKVYQIDASRLTEFSDRREKSNVDGSIEKRGPTPRVDEFAPQRSGALHVPSDDAPNTFRMRT